MLKFYLSKLPQEGYYRPSAERGARMILVDSHCHLNLYQHEDFKKILLPKLESGVDYDSYYSVDNVVKRAREAGVKYMVNIGDTLFNLVEQREITFLDPWISRTVGVHPENARDHLHKLTTTEIGRKILIEGTTYGTVGIGEIGLDFHKGREDEHDQMFMFYFQMNFAEHLDLPVEIHSRMAQKETLEVLRMYPKVKGAIHCFSGERDFAEAVLDLGYYISVGGSITYKNSNELRETIKNIPIDRLLLETDAPFLTPVPKRGKINEPSFVKMTAEFVAELLEISVEELAEKTTENFFRLFSRARR